MTDRTFTAKLPQCDTFGVPEEEKPGIRVLIVECDRAMREAINTAIRLEGYASTAIGCSSEAVRTLSHADFDIVLTDVGVFTSSDFEIIRSARQSFRDPIIIAITDSSTNTGSRVLRTGAWDCLVKPFSSTQLKLLIGRAARAVLQTRAIRKLSAELDRVVDHNDHSAIIGTSSAITTAVRQARKLAPTTAPVLIVGEPGTGTELFAHFIHQQSLRAAQPFITVNCAALPEPLLDVEIFGSREPVNGSNDSRRGLLNAARGGVLFLDDLLDMPLSLQSKLVRVLEERSAGQDRTYPTTSALDVRFISAMTRDPEEAVQSGKLREDLLEELGVTRIRVPPLRERREDIDLLATNFLAAAWLRHRVAGVAAPRLSSRSLQFLRSLPWRGNVRELRNVIEHVAARAEPNQQIEPEHIPFTDQLSFEPIGFDASVANDALREAYHTAKDRLLNEFERVYFRRLVDTAEGNLARAARLANVDRTTLYRLIEKHNIGVRRQGTSEAGEIDQLASGSA